MDEDKGKPESWSSSASGSLSADLRMTSSLSRSSGDGPRSVDGSDLEEMVDVHMCYSGELAIYSPDRVCSSLRRKSHVRRALILLKTTTTTNGIV